MRQHLYIEAVPRALYAQHLHHVVIYHQLNFAILQNEKYILRVFSDNMAYHNWNENTEFFNFSLDQDVDTLWNDKTCILFSTIYFSFYISKVVISLDLEALI